MGKLNIFCTSIKYFSIIDKMPEYITGLGLSDSYFPKTWLDDSKGINIRSLNKYYGELTGFYWIWKNKLNWLENDDFIGFCHYRKFWLDDKNLIKTLTFKSLYSILLNDQNKIFTSHDVVQVNPIIFKNKTLLEDFSKIHDKEVILNCLNLLDHENKSKFAVHLTSNVFYPLNMFITKKYIFESYCGILFPWLEKCMELVIKDNILKNYNIRLPAFLAERFTSYWFSQFEKRTTLPYARLGKFFLSNKVNKFINPIKLPFTSKMYPTIHNY